MIRFLFKFIFAVFVCLLSEPALVYAKNSPATISVEQRFKPVPALSDGERFDFRIWDDFLYNYVLFTGPSTREYLRRPLAATGSRKYYGHTSPYRAEGNKLLFSHMKKDTKQDLTRYKERVLAWGEKTEIMRLPQDEQLAYWANLHNIVLIETLANAYPVKDPAEFIPKGYNQELNDAKLITLKGQKLSLRDIREKIVFSNRDDPRVIYLFWTAEISGPSLPYTAYTGGNVWTLADEIADEYVNSLRGFHVHNGQKCVSQFYLNHAEFYFPNFEKDVLEHMDEYIRPHVRADFETDYPIKIDRYHTRIADISGGYRKRHFSTKNSYDMTQMSATEVRLYQRLEKKRQQQIKRGFIRPGEGIVIIEDIKTIDEFEVPEIQFKSTLTFKPAHPVEETPDDIDSEEAIEE